MIMVYDARLTSGAEFEKGKPPAQHDVSHLCVWEVLAEIGAVLLWIES